MKLKKLDYRYDIQGLRALAVIIVVLFHTDWPLFSGGFVGVDIFLVITRIIYSKLQNNSFSFTDFYLKRARRLMPALFITLSTSSIASFLLLTPSHFKRYGVALISSVYSLANIFFLGETGYFNTESMFKPLLHMWSLSLEEQFYLIWPFTIFILYKLFSNRIFTFILIFGVISFILNGIYISDQEAIFYLLPFRVFEFCIGASVIWLSRIDFKKSWIHEILILISLILMIYPVFTFSKATVFPYYNALTPCLGAVLLIFSGGKSRLASIFKNKFMVYTGSISYSWYLVHWPLFILYKYWYFKELRTTSMIILVFISYVLACILHHFIEEPMRQKDIGYKLSNKVFLLFLLAMIIGLSSFGIITWKEKWGQSRQYLKKISHDYKKVLSRPDCIKNKGICKIDNTIQYDAALVGDSHANFTFIYSVIASHNNLVIKHFPGLSACFALFDNTLDCQNVMNKQLNFIIENKIKRVFLASNWSIYTHQYSADWIFKKLKKTIETLRKNNIDVYVWGSMPFLSRTPQSCFDRPFRSGECDVFMKPINYPDQIKYNNDLKKVVIANDGRYFDLFKELCNDNNCRVAYDGMSLYSDRYHIHERNFGGYLYMKYFHNNKLTFEHLFVKH